MERTGHRSVEGVRSYKRTSDQQEQAVSDTLCLSKRPNTAPPKNNTVLCIQTIELVLFYILIHNSAIL